MKYVYKLNTSQLQNKSKKRFATESYCVVTKIELRYYSLMTIRSCLLPQSRYVSMFIIKLTKYQLVNNLSKIAQEPVKEKE